MTTSPKERESLKWSVEEIDLLREQLSLDGVVLLQTCNRVELIIDGSSESVGEIIDVWSAKSSVSFSESWVTTFVNESNVLSYLLELTTGLHSEIQLDDQIHGQVKKAFIDSLQKKWHSARLERAFQMLMRYRKALINRTSYNKGSISLAYNVHKEIRALKGTTNHCSLLLIGAGDMAQQIVKYLSSFKYDKVTIANRSILNAHRIANHGNVTCKDLDGIPQSIEEADIVINCIGHDIFENDFKGRAGQIYVDLSNNQVLDTKIKDKDKLIGLDQLISTIKNNEKSRDCLPHILPLIDEFVLSYMSWSEKYLLRRRA